MVNCVDCVFLYIDDIDDEWHCKKDHFVPTTPDGCPMDRECRDYKSIYIEEDDNG